jgi:hypothetical protein
MTRWKAAGTHFALSVLVIGSIALSAFLLWYPHALYKVAGLDRILIIMLGIDLTAGPLLTLIVFRRGKPSLKFDLTVIAIAQLAFLGYGLNTLWQGRPVFLVGTPETFTLVFANEIDDADLTQAPKLEWRTLPWNGPHLVATRMPDAPEERRNILEDFMAGGAGIERTPKYYLDFAVVAPRILEASHALPSADGVTDDEVRATGHARAQLRWMPIVSRRASGTLLIDANTAMPLHTLAREIDSTVAAKP